MRVITHEGRGEKRIDLCEKHSTDAIVQEWVGADYFGVHRGLHYGVCAQCTLRSYIVATDVGEGVAMGHTLNEAARRWARSQGIPGVNSMDDLGTHYRQRGGWITMTDADGVVVLRVNKASLTYEEAIARLVDRDVEQWGEHERVAAERVRRTNCPTLGRALNALAHYYPGYTNEALAAEARQHLTPEDWVALRQGG